METTQYDISFDDFANMDPLLIRDKIWKDFTRQHRIPEAYRISTSQWAAALAHAKVRVANVLMSAASPDLRSKIASIVIYHPTALNESLEAQAQIANLYRFDLIPVRYPYAIHELKTQYDVPSIASEISKHVNFRDAVLLESSGVAAATQFREASLIFAIEQDYEQIQRAYRMVMDDPDDVLRVIVFDSDPLDIATGRLDFVHARPEDFRGDGAKFHMSEFIRVLHSGGKLCVEGARAEIEKVLQRHSEFVGLSPTFACVTKA